MINRCYLIVMLFLLSFSHSPGQVPVFATTISNSFGGSENEDFFSGTKTKDGGYLMTGLTNSTDGDIDPLMAYDTSNILLVKCDSNGNKLWARTYGGNAYDKARYVFQDNDSNILVVGGTFSSDGDMTANYGASDLFVLKLDQDGNTIWTKNYGGTGGDGGRFISQLSSGDYVIAGYTTSHNFDVSINRGMHDGWLLKIDTAGTLIWSQTYGGSGDDRMRSFTEAPDGGFVFFGSSSSNDFQLSGNHGGYDYWAGKADSLGNLIWTYVYGGSGEELGYHVISVSDGTYLCSGATASSDGDVIGFKGGYDGWLIKIDDAGTLVWQRPYGGTKWDRFHRCYELPSGDFQAFGFSQSSDDDLAGYNTGPSNNYWLMQLDPALNQVWGYCTGGSSGDLGTEFIYDSYDSSFVLMGESKSNDGTVLNNHGLYDFWMIKLVLFTFLPETGSSPWQAYYDPINSTMNFSGINHNALQIEIFDTAGKRLYQLNRMPVEDGKATVDVFLKTGVYLCRVDDGKNNKVFRFAVNR